MLCVGREGKSLHGDFLSSNHYSHKGKFPPRTSRSRSTSRARMTTNAHFTCLSRSLHDSSSSASSHSCRARSRPSTRPNNKKTMPKLEAAPQQRLALIWCALCALLLRSNFALRHFYSHHKRRALLHYTWSWTDEVCMIRTNLRVIIVPHVWHRVTCHE